MLPSLITIKSFLALGWSNIGVWLYLQKEMFAQIALLHGGAKGFDVKINRHHSNSNCFLFKNCIYM